VVTLIAFNGGGGILTGLEIRIKYCEFGVPWAYEILVVPQRDGGKVNRPGRAFATGFVERSG